ncbi:MAG: beta strand repeat-containing protein, partial [Gaiellaceae bacterium]
PASATITSGGSQTYSAEGVGRFGNSLGDVSGSTTFTISPDGSCSGNVCTATTAGPHTVTGSAVGKSDTAALTVSAGPLDHLSLSPSSALIAPDNSQSYSADGFDQYGNTLGDVTADTTFTIDPDGACTANLCTASLQGTHTVTGSSLRATGTAVLTISSTPVDHITISPASASIVAGASQTYTADAIDADGNVLGDITGATGFTITPDGSCSGNVCTATVAGDHTVTGTSGGNTSTAALTVTPASLDHVALSPASATITSGGSQTYSAEGVGRFGNSLGDVTAGTTFTIGPDGSCTGNTCSASTAGTHTVTGHDGGKTGTASLQVAGGTLDHIVISPAPATISAGGSQSYNAEAFDAAGNALGDVTAGTTFTILPNGSCSSNVCSATVAGNHTVTGTNAGKTSSATLTVKPGTLDHLALSPSSATISAGDSLVYSAQGRDQYDNSLGDITSSTTFTIAPDGSCVGATCTATTAGAHTVTGASVGATGTAGLQVDAGALDHLVLVPGVASIVAGGSRVYAAEGRDQYENSLGNVTAKTSFAIAPDGSCSGATCTASVGGSHTVTGSDAGKSGTARLDVDAASVDHIVISPASTSIAAGGAQTYTAEAFDAADDPLGDVTGSTTFTVSPDGSCSGNVCTATVAGAHTVTGSSGANSSAADLAVAPAGLDHLVLSPASASISAGGSQAYGAEGRDRYDNSLGDLTVTTTFTIAPDGSCTGNVCTAGIDGSHTVSGSNTGKAGSATLDVSPAGLDHIVISPTTATISAGGSQSYSAEAFDKADNSLGDVTNSTSFTITPDGTCTANTCTTTTAGPHTVTGTDSSKTSSATLTVKPGPLDHLALSPGSASIIAGGSEAFSAQGRDQYDNTLDDATANTTFTIAPDGSCTAAACTATTAGGHTVTGTWLGATGSAILQVGPAAVSRIDISPDTATISAGGSQSYSAQGFDEYDNPLGDVAGSTTFAISPDGSCSANTCTATLGGPHTVNATDAGATATATLAVSYVKNSGFETDLSGWNSSGSGANVTLTRVAGGHSGNWAARLANNGTTASTWATLQDAPNWVNPSSAGTYTGTLWVRSDSAGAILKLKLQEYSGSTLLGSTSAQTTLTTSWQQLSATYTVKSPGSTLDFQAFVQNVATGTAFYADDAAIFRGSIDHIALTPASAGIAAGGSQRYSVEGFDAAGNSFGDITGSTTFTIAPDGSCNASLCTATKTGTHTITASSGGKTSMATLNVTPGPLDHLVLSPVASSIVAGGSQVYAAEGRDQFENSLGDVTAKTTFSIAPDGSCSGATCSASVGGSHTVTGSDAGKSGNATLSVDAASVDHIVVTPGSASIAAGGAQTYTAEAFDAAGNALGDVTGSTSFTISPGGSCSANVCTATTAGAHTVTASSGSNSGSASLTVVPAALDHLVLSPASASISAGGSQAYSAEGRDRYENSLGDLTAATTFTIAPDGSCSGNVCSADRDGSHTVSGSNTGTTGSATLQVTPAGLDHIVISPTNATISAGGSQSYTAEAFDSAGNSVGDVTNSTSFTVAPDGTCSANTCTAILGGPHTVTATNVGKTATATLSVSYVKNSGFETDLSGWNSSGSGANVTLTRAAGGHSGNWAARLTNNGSTNSSFATLQDAPNWVAATTAGTYTGTLWARSDTAGAILKLKLQEYSGSTLLGSTSTQTTLTTSWQQLTVTYTVKSAGSTLDFQAFVQNVATGTAFYADDAAIVRG